MQSIFDRIEYLIEQKGITKKSFCEQLNISSGHFGDWKRKKSTPGTHHLIRIAEFFHVTLDWLILGKSAGDGVREEGEAYFSAQMRQLSCQSEELLPKEQEFIKEYIAFTRYRRQKQDEENS
ncbi:MULTISPECIES: helix-turn-helix domain-containing protein [unclassified Paenibacillus]|uniref:helix-turn-helix domain-containing protein n=1 Tax=unclassified Paenibacillus TaxID=185978 RepID=UPI002404A881|nr:MULTISPECIES: helix-turn-helix domain-containing protein [unclassified Paenibacillus]MDF9842034.1 transcriptional regulator with XRE-family HTH domain [Paenibacillus sp. PastF-2]MDF9848712.1 transcriptional regulator with XRE-family HTH domain [Paenibacillus sp. PastM-2]MDF9855281.1 transcriptional regulator with XRE-family HTH domain [Paenibacillus sp. PastF-1]MDH6480552.1 transcriptional regulator with XRE-family HTH domain [Paenibacillus sp. PastH-2]MDH6507978.1 transcriptional regulator